MCKKGSNVTNSNFSTDDRKGNIQTTDVQIPKSVVSLKVNRGAIQFYNKKFILFPVAVKFAFILFWIKYFSKSTKELITEISFISE